MGIGVLITIASLATGLLASETDMKIDEQAASLILQLPLVCWEQDYYHKKYVEFTLQ